MLLSQPVVGDQRFGFGKGSDNCSLGPCGYVSERTRYRKEPEKAACFEAYPSPPMSGSQPPTSAGAPAANDPRHGRAIQPPTTSHDATRGVVLPQMASEFRGGPAVAPRPVAQVYRPEPPAGPPYAFQRPEAASARPLSYPQTHDQGMQQHHYMNSGSASGSVAYPVTARPQTMEHPPYTPPKSQRKTKGHVASACVPCKKAHLRCDSQRPCSRCIANGKEDACIDVQHKKRGRPRLRDDRDARYDPSRLPLPQDGTRRPLQVYPAAGSGVSGYEDPLRRAHNYRVLKSQPSESVGPRYLDRASAADAIIYTPSLSIATRPPEPALYLTLDLDIVKASTTFVDVIGSPEVTGRKLIDIVGANDRERVMAIRAEIQDEQRREQPNYLPPILDRGHQIIQSLGFGSEDLARYKLEHQEYWHFLGADGHARPCPVKLGLAREGSFFFIAAVLSSPSRYPYPSPSPHSRDGSSLYHGTPRTPQSAYTQHTPVSATFDLGRNMLGEAPLPPRPSGPPSAQLLSHSPGLSSGGPSYSPTPTRQDFPGPSPTYAIPRSNPLPPARAVGPPSYQLPPIRPQTESGSQPLLSEPSQQRDERQRDERSGRVDIGGLIERPEASGGPR